MVDQAALEAKARAWALDDPDPTTRAELEALLREGAWDELTDRFRMRLEFGTAGLRGVLGAGPNRMNLAVVRAATAGLVTYVARQVEGAAERGIVIGYDGRRLSRELAYETAEVALGAGFRVAMFDGPVPTPIVGFASRTRNAATAVVVTASHNPPEYNGYKVYWANGAQIIPPHDAGIAAAIDGIGKLADVPRRSVEEGRAAGRFELLGDAARDEYFRAIATLPLHAGRGRSLRIAYTALHGVGDGPTRRALREAGFSDVHSVAEQAEPDGAFPTVRFPNPEEKGAMDLVLALATKVDAELVLANDPDADRLAVATRVAPGKYVQLTGNDVGCLLGHYLLEHGTSELAKGSSPKRAVVSSLVSSPLLGAIARAHGAHWEETLTGFKWIANRAISLTDEGYRFVMGYEEALGYTVGDVVRDKDGVGAALVMADLVGFLSSEGRTVTDDLDVVARRYGLFVSKQVSVTKPGQDGAAAIAETMRRVRGAPPSELAGVAVTAVQDLDRGERRASDGQVTKLTFPPSNVIALELAGGHRIMLRPSGTEPKIKYYFDVCEPVGAKEHTSSARARADQVLERLVTAFLAYLERLG